LILTGAYIHILPQTHVCAYLKYNNNDGANFWKLSAFSRVELVRGCNSERPQAFSTASVRNLANNPSQIPEISLPRWRRIYIYIYIYIYICVCMQNVLRKLIPRSTLRWPQCEIGENMEDAQEQFGRVFAPHSSRM